MARVPQLRRYMKMKMKEQFDRAVPGVSTTTTPRSNGVRTACWPKRLPGGIADRTVAPADYELFAELSPDEVAAVQALLERRKFQRGEVIVQFGAPAGELYFLARGRASATLSRRPTDAKSGWALFRPAWPLAKWPCWTAHRARPR